MDFLKENTALGLSNGFLAIISNVQFRKKFCKWESQNLKREVGMSLGAIKRVKDDS